MKNLGLCQKACTGQSVYGHALNREILPLKEHYCTEQDRMVGHVYYRANRKYNIDCNSGQDIRLVLSRQMHGQTFLRDSLDKMHMVRPNQIYCKSGDGSKYRCIMLSIPLEKYDKVTEFLLRRSLAQRQLYMDNIWLFYQRVWIGITFLKWHRKIRKVIAMTKMMFSLFVFSIMSSLASGFWSQLWHL